MNGGNHRLEPTTNVHHWYAHHGVFQSVLYMECILIQVKQIKIQAIFF